MPEVERPDLSHRRHAIQIVAHEAAVVPIAVLKRVEWNVDYVVEILHLRADVLAPGCYLLPQYADHFEPGVVQFDELAGRRFVTKKVDLRGFAQNAYGRAGRIFAGVEESSFRNAQVVYYGIGRLNAI